MGRHVSIVGTQASNQWEMRERTPSRPETGFSSHLLASVIPVEPRLRHNLECSVSACSFLDGSFHARTSQVCTFSKLVCSLPSEISTLYGLAPLAHCVQLLRPCKLLRSPQRTQHNSPPPAC